MSETSKRAVQRVNQARARHNGRASPAAMTAEATPGARDRARWAILLLAIIGAIVASYLTYVHVANVAAICGAFGDCETVNKGPYSVIAGIPVSAFGLAMYIALAVLVGMESSSALLQDYSPLAVFALAFFGVIFSAYLTYLELFVIHAICPWCVISAIVITLVLGLSIVRLRRAMAE